MDHHDDIPRFSLFSHRRGQLNAKHLDWIDISPMCPILTWPCLKIALYFPSEAINLATRLFIMWVTRKLSQASPVIYFSCLICTLRRPLFFLAVIMVECYASQEGMLLASIFDFCLQMHWIDILLLLSLLSHWEWWLMTKKYSCIFQDWNIWVLKHLKLIARAATRKWNPGNQTNMERAMSKWSLNPKS